MNALIRRRMMMALIGGEEPIPVPPDNQIWYDAASQVTLYSPTNVLSHTFANGRGIITFSINPTAVGSSLRGTAITKVYLPSVATSIGSSAFQNCTSLAFASLPSGVTSIGTSAFYGCSSLVLTSLPSGVTSIGTSAFQGCSSLALTSLPSGVTNIKGSAFYGCRAITSLRVPIVTPPTCGNNAFKNTTFPIYVPAESVAAYKSASGWSSYASRISAIPT